MTILEGDIGMEHAAGAAPDGNTTVMALTVQPAIHASLFHKLPYDPIRDFTPITLLAQASCLLVVQRSLPVKSVKKIVSLARARPNQVIDASSGNGSGDDLAAELLNGMPAIRVLHVSYKGGGPALADLLAGQVQVLFATYASGRGHVRSGRMRALAVSTAKRPATIPGLPTIARAGVPGHDLGVWYALLAPAGTSRDIIGKLNREIVRALKHPDYH